MVDNSCKAYISNCTFSIFSTQKNNNNTSQFFYRKVYIDCTIYRYAIVSPIQGQYLLITPMLTNSLICLGSQSQWDMLMSCLNKLFLNGTEARGWPPPAVISCPRPVCISFAANALVLAIARPVLYFVFNEQVSQKYLYSI